MIESVNLSIWLDDGTYSELPLSSMQVVTLIHILGIEPLDECGVKCYSDETLQRFFDMQGNPLRLTRKDQE